VGVRSPLASVIEPLRAGDPGLERVHDIERTSLDHDGGSCVGDQLDEPFTHAWVARDPVSLDPQGFILTWLVADELHVLDVATAPELRRCGVGRALMEQAIAFSRAHAAQLILLEVRRGNVPAVRLYRSLGFRITRLRSRYYQDDEDALEMALVFDPETGDIVPGVDEVQLEEV